MLWMSFHPNKAFFTLLSTGFPIVFFNHSGTTLLIFGITKSNFILKPNSAENKHDALIAVQREGKGASEPFYSEMDMATVRHFPVGVGILP